MMLHKIKMLKLCQLIAIMALLCNAASVYSSDDCGTLKNRYGPFDYTNPDHVKNKLPIVTYAHFTSRVERLERGETGVRPIGDIDYTLRAFPNHHRALNAVGRYRLKHPKTANDRFYSGKCYFLRAIEFKPDDPLVYSLYGIYLYQKGDFDGSLQQYKNALVLNPDFTEVHYNIGILYTKLDKFKLAKEHAEIAYRQGYPLPGLKNILQRKGAWDK